MSASSEVNTVNSSTPDEKTSPARIAFSKALEMMQKFALDESGNMKHPGEVVEECKRNSESWNSLGMWETKITEGSEDKYRYFYVDYIYDVHALFPPRGNRTVCLRYLSFIRPTTTGEMRIRGDVYIKQNTNSLLDGDKFSYVFSSQKSKEELKSKWAACKVWANSVADSLLPKEE